MNVVNSLSPTLENRRSSLYRVQSETQRQEDRAVKVSRRCRSNSCGWASTLAFEQSVNPLHPQHRVRRHEQKSGVWAPFCPHAVPGFCQRLLALVQRSKEVSTSVADICRCGVKHDSAGGTHSEMPPSSQATRAFRCRAVNSSWWSQGHMVKTQKITRKLSDPCDWLSGQAWVASETFSGVARSERV